MSDSELTAAQAEVLRKVPDRIPLERVERVWIFPPHLGKARETGLVVVSTKGIEPGTEGLKGLVTIRYAVETVKDTERIEETFNEEGWAPRDRIDRVMSGVLARAGGEVGEPIEAEIDGDAERWRELLDRLGVELDPASQ